MNPEMDYQTVGGSRWTFEDKPTREFVEARLSGRTLNPFAGEVELEHDAEIIRNDKNPERPAEYHEDAKAFVQRFEDRSIGTIIHDPPWSEYQAETVYADYNPENIAELKREYHRLLQVSGVVIQFGYSTVCMPGELEYSRDEVVVFQPYGYRNAYLGTVDRKQPRISQNEP